MIKSPPTGSGLDPHIRPNPMRSVNTEHIVGWVRGLRELGAVIDQNGKD